MPGKLGDKSNYQFLNKTLCLFKFWPTESCLEYEEGSYAPGVFFFLDGALIVSFALFLRQYKMEWCIPTNDAMLQAYCSLYMILWALCL